MILRTLLVKLGFKGDVSKLVDFDNKITGLKTNILGLGAIFASTTVALGYFLNEAAKLEQTKIAFEVMTNSVQLGQKLIKDLFRFARTTPFQIPGVLQASKILLAMGVTAEEQIDVLTKIGHVAAGITKPLDQLASIFGRVRAAGYLTGYEMERLRRAGVPLGQYLSELLKRPEKDILQMIRRKEISFEIFAEGWDRMVKHRFPKLMDKLLLTFKGITSNIKDYIYEIVAFSGEELLPVFRLMANQLMYLLDASRALISLKFKQFFGGISSALVLLNKGFIKLYFRTRETITQFGGINRIFKIFIALFGTFIGMKSLALLGKIGKITFGLLTFASLKLVLIGAGMLLILGITEDLFGYLIGKESRIKAILNDIEKRFPKFHKALMSILRIIKKEIEGLTLILIGLFTFDKEIIMAGVKQVEEAWNLIEDVYDKAIKRIGSKIMGLATLILGMQTFNPYLLYKGMKLVGKKEQKIHTKEGKEEQKVYTKDMNFIERMIAQDKILVKMAELTEKVKIKVDEIFQPATISPLIQIGEGMFPQFDIGDIIESRRKMLPEKLLTKGEQLRKGLGININMPVAIEFKNLPEKVDKERIVTEIKNTLNDVVTKNLDNRLKAEYSDVQPEQE